MKILMLTPYLPYPLTSGGQIRSYNLLKNLASRHQITLFAFIRHPEEKKYLKNLAGLCHEIRVFKRRRAWSPLNIFLAGVTPMPFLLSIYYSPAFKRAIKQQLDEEDYDLIHIECFYLMHNLPRTKVPVLLVEQTIEYLVYQSVVENNPFWPLKPALYFDVAKIKSWEKRFWRQAARLVTMSEEDKEYIRDRIPGKAIDNVSNGVDVDFFQAVERKPVKKPTILFVGQFRWHPNVDAARFLANEVWPLIKNEVPHAQLWIIGRNPTAPIRSLAQGVDVTVQEVEDIRRVLSQAHVLLAPIRNGRGTKYKVLEAMAAGLPVVTTPLGIEGIRARGGREVLVGETAVDLAKETVAILRQPELGAKIARQAKRLVINYYHWPMIADELDRVYQEVGAKT